MPLDSPGIVENNGFFQIYNLISHKGTTNLIKKIPSNETQYFSTFHCEKHNLYLPKHINRYILKFMLKPLIQYIFLKTYDFTLNYKKFA